MACGCSQWSAQPNCLSIEPTNNTHNHIYTHTHTHKPLKNFPRTEWVESAAASGRRRAAEKNKNEMFSLLARFHVICSYTIFLLASSRIEFHQEKCEKKMEKKLNYEELRIRIKCAAPMRTRKKEKKKLYQSKIKMNYSSGVFHAKFFISTIHRQSGLFFPFAMTPIAERIETEFARQPKNQSSTRPKRILNTVYSKMQKKYFLERKKL